jgi:hypothetical protein
MDPFVDKFVEVVEAMCGSRLLRAGDSVSTQSAAVIEIH